MPEATHPIVDPRPEKPSIGEKPTQLPAEKERERLEKERAEAELKDWEGRTAGGDYGRLVKAEIKSMSDSSTWIVEEHVYLGPGGPVAVPCTRGEQKAEYGDLIVRTLIPGPTPEEDVTIIDVVPHEVIPDDVPEGMTNKAYSDFLIEKDKKLKERVARPDNTLPSRPGTGVGLPEAPRPQVKK